jgi:hypothetical protein
MTGTWDESKHPRDHGKFATSAGSAEEAIAQARRVAEGYKPLPGMNPKPIEVRPGEWFMPGPNANIKDTAALYMKQAGLPYNPPPTYQKADPTKGGLIAQEYERMQHAPNDPAVKASYDALKREVLAQWHALRDFAGIKVDWIKPGQRDPYYETPRLAEKDVSENKHWWGYPSDLGFGGNTEAEREAARTNPLLEKTGEVIGGREVSYNDVFRLVHDMYGHIAEGNGFRADGEDNAFRQHAAMFSEAALPALTSETRGQASWVNFGPYGEYNRKSNAPDVRYAAQKTGIMPEWTWRDVRR